MQNKLPRLPNIKGTLAILAMAKPIANLAQTANVTPTPTRSTTHQARATRHKPLYQSDQSSFCLLDRFLQLAFCWRSPPQGRRPGRSGPVGPQEIFLFLLALALIGTRNFFYKFPRPLAKSIRMSYARVVTTLSHLGKIVTCLKVSLLQRVKSKRQKRY